MITEDYVSFEIAKLLKEKGFDERCHMCWDEVTKTMESADECATNSELLATYISSPTLQMVMKWLREVHNFVIEPYRTACGYLYTISSIPYGSTKYDNSQAFNGDDEDSGQWSTWEKACEDGIKYCLENLI